MTYICHLCNKEKLDVYFRAWRDIDKDTKLYPKGHVLGRQLLCKDCSCRRTKRSAAKHKKTHYDFGHSSKVIWNRR